MLKNTNLQLLAEDETVDSDLEQGQADSADNAGEADDSQKVGYNEEEANRIASERAERASRSALKSYFKQQGLSEAEAREAIEAFKTQKAAQAEEERNNLSSLQQKLNQYEKGETETMRMANLRLVRAEAMIQAMSLNIKPDRVDYAIRLADLAQIEVDDQGKPDETAIQAALKKVTEDIPELLNPKTEEQKQGFKVGSPGQQNKNNDETLSKIFGNT